MSSLESDSSETGIFGHIYDTHTAFSQAGKDGVMLDFIADKILHKPALNPWYVASAI